MSQRTSVHRAARCKQPRRALTASTPRIRFSHDTLGPMRARPWAGIVFVAGLVACSTKGTPATNTTSAGASAGTGGAGGGGGFTTSTTTASAGGQGPAKCSSSYTTVPKGNCDLLQQNCDAGSTCTPVDAGGAWASTCQAGSGLKSEGETCNDADECDAKLFCIESKCTAVCCRDNNKPCNGGICDLSVNLGGATMFVCHYAPKCNLLTSAPAQPANPATSRTRPRAWRPAPTSTARPPPTSARAPSSTTARTWSIVLARRAAARVTTTAT